MDEHKKERIKRKIRLKTMRKILAYNYKKNWKSEMDMTPSQICVKSLQICCKKEKI